MRLKRLSFGIVVGTVFTGIALAVDPCYVAEAANACCTPHTTTCTLGPYVWPCVSGVDSGPYTVTVSTIAGAGKQGHYGPLASSSTGKSCKITPWTCDPINPNACKEGTTYTSYCVNSAPIGEACTGTGGGVS